MGQKVNPHGLRVGVIKEWDSRWYAEKDFADNLVEDNNLRTTLTDYYTRFCCVDDDFNFIRCTLDFDFGNASAV